MFITKIGKTELMQRNGGMAAATRLAGNLGCGETGKNPLPGWEFAKAQGICAVGMVVLEGQGFVAAQGPFFGYFFWPRKKSDPAGRA